MKKMIIIMAALLMLAGCSRSDKQVNTAAYGTGRSISGMESTGW